MKLSDHTNAVLTALEPYTANHLRVIANATNKHQQMASSTFFGEKPVVIIGMVRDTGFEYV
jgi:hypothetical protein